jgi:hypothetical protein
MGGTFERLGSVSGREVESSVGMERRLEFVKAQEEILKNGN